MKKLIVAVGMITLISLAGEPIAHAAFTNSSLRGRYTGGVAIQENISDGNGGGSEAQGNELLVLNFDGQGGVTGTAAVTGRSLAGGTQSFSCTFTCTGTYDVTSEGLVTSTFAL